MRQESHRVYWQHWGGTSGGGGGTSGANEPQSRRELITSSVAVGISEAARAKDVTKLLRRTLNLTTPTTTTVEESSSTSSSSSIDDYLVLVGTVNTFIHFEHEEDPKTTTEPMHVVRTLKPDENPLSVRDSILEHVRQTVPPSSQTINTVVSPKLQWYFVPRTVSSHIPNYIELDGYCTSMEDESDDDEDDDDDSKDEDNDHECQSNDNATHPLHNILSFETNFPIQAPRPNGDAPSLSFQRHAQRIIREEHRFHQLTSCELALDRQIVSGYLLKRSHHDIHVWRRVHCVLTDDHLWHVTRLHYSSSFSKTEGKGGNEQRGIAYHGRVSLMRALLLESTATSSQAPLSRIPHAFELVSKSGKSHVFRAANRALQLRWIQCLADRIVQCHENKVMEHAELIVENEAWARNQRLSNLAFQPLAQSLGDCQSDTNDNHNGDSSVMSSILRWGLDVVDYRERCRHVQSRMPVKGQRVVVDLSGDQATAPSNPNVPTPRKLFSSPIASDRRSKVHGMDGRGDDPEDDRDIREMVRAAWDAAAVLLAKATTTQLSMDRDGKKRSMSRKLESLCRHVDYVITGRFRPLSEAIGENTATTTTVDRGIDRSYDPPPIDLFDPLLAELQTQAGKGIPTQREKNNSNSREVH